ncbi:hypothetical protein MXD63_23025 [Frankia sp. Cpl3]|nr:hypothetical protein [Frankia sp. Cpl3]
MSRDTRPSNIPTSSRRTTTPRYDSGTGNAANSARRSTDRGEPAMIESTSCFIFELPPAVIGGRVTVRRRPALRTRRSAGRLN